MPKNSALSIRAVEPTVFFIKEKEEVLQAADVSLAHREGAQILAWSSMGKENAEFMFPTFVNQQVRNLPYQLMRKCKIERGLLGNYRSIGNYIWLITPIMTLDIQTYRQIFCMNTTGSMIKSYIFVRDRGLA